MQHMRQSNAAGSQFGDWWMWVDIRHIMISIFTLVAERAGLQESWRSEESAVIATRSHILGAHTVHIVILKASAVL